MKEELKMNILRCRAYTRQHIREHSVEVDQLEGVVFSTVCKLNVVRKENERFIIFYIVLTRSCIFCRLKKVREYMMHGRFSQFSV